MGVRKVDLSSFILHPSSLLQQLSLERAAAAARFDGIRVVEFEAAGLQAFVEVDGRAVEIECALLVDDDGHTVVFVLRIRLFVEALIETEGVGEPAAAAA